MPMRQEWSSALQGRGFSLNQVRNSLEGLQLFAQLRHEIALLHRSAAGAEDTITLGSTLRRLRPNVGIVLVGSTWNPAERRRLMADFADECLALDTEVEELIAVSTALGRRAQGFAQACCRLGSGSLRLDFMGGFVAIGSAEIRLQPLQMRILACLVEYSGTVVSYEQLRHRVFRLPRISRTSITRQICVLRRQLGPFGAEIATAEGGYRLGLP